MVTRVNRLIVFFDYNVKKHPYFVGMFYASTEIRTLVLALKGLRPSPLDDGGVLIAAGILSSHPKWVKQNPHFRKKKIRRRQK